MKIITSLILMTLLTGCADTLKAPCNYSGSNCSPRIKINQWNAN